MHNFSSLPDKETISLDLSIDLLIGKKGNWRYYLPVWAFEYFLEWQELFKN